MSEGRPRRSAASASSKAWAGLMPNAQHKDDLLGDDYVEPPPKQAPKRVPAESGSTPGARGRRPAAKKPRTSEGEGVELPSSPTSNPPQQVQQSPPVVAPEVKTPARQAKKPAPSSPTKLQHVAPQKPVAHLPAPPVGGNLTVANDHEMQLMAQEFDRHNSSLHAAANAFEEEEEPERKPVAAPPARNRPRAPPKPVAPEPAHDEPSDPDYTDESPERPVRPARKRPPPQPKPRPPVAAPVPPPQAPRNPVLRQAAPRPAQVVVRPAQNRVFMPRMPTVVNGGPRVVQPRYPPNYQQARVVNTNVLKQAPQVTNYDTPHAVTKNIEKFTEELKLVDAPELRSAFELIDLLRGEAERMHNYIRDTNTYYVQLVEDVQTAAQAQFEQQQNRIQALERHNINLEGQLKKASAIAHQKVLKTALDSLQIRSTAGGHLDQPSSSKVLHQPQQHHYVVVEGEPAPVEQQPSDYLVQSDEYAPQSYYGAHDAVIQEASKELDNIM
uniref:CCHC-type domain-containing protein n=1 Tax=Panagrellus redivivus TaxID=6233 RepID=A0A7E4ZRM3_PANRE